jgi:hypothetical protein
MSNFNTVTIQNGTGQITDTQYGLRLLEQIFLELKLHTVILKSILDGSPIEEEDIEGATLSGEGVNV